MNFRSIEQLGRCIRRNLHKVPADVDVVVSVPRSGLLPGVLVANHLNLPHLTIADFVEGRAAQGGRRVSSTSSVPFQKALVLDDSVATGAENKRIRELLVGLPKECTVLLGAVYVAPGKEATVDLYFEVLEEPRMFEWNMMNHYLLPSACVDIDGVLCRDPVSTENDDGHAYRRFLGSVEPLFRPGTKIGWLVTSRLEKYRELTEAWLSSNGVSYGELRMLDLPSASDRIRLRAHARFKASIYNSTPSKLFIESTDSQSEEIVERTGKPVLSIESCQLFHPGRAQVLKGKVVRLGWSVPRRLRRWLG
jgi:uncharacterized HAD superfamily protein/hypoxanthine phosphoribosyltransferase